MTKNEKIVLSEIAARYHAGLRVDTVDIRFCSKLSPGEFDEVCIYLAEKGYFTDLKNNLATSSYTFYTTYKSQYYKQISRDEKLSFILKSILTPIAVSIISNVVITLIKP